MSDTVRVTVRVRRSSLGCGVDHQGAAHLIRCGVGHQDAAKHIRVRRRSLECGVAHQGALQLVSVRRSSWLACRATVRLSRVPFPQSTPPSAQQAETIYPGAGVYLHTVMYTQLRKIPSSGRYPAQEDTQLRKIPSSGRYPAQEDIQLRRIPSSE